jgi:hypothetical protein
MITFPLRAYVKAAGSGSQVSELFVTMMIFDFEGFLAWSCRVVIPCLLDDLLDNFWDCELLYDQHVTQ